MIPLELNNLVALRGMGQRVTVSHLEINIGFISYVIGGRSLNFFEPRFSHLQNGENNAYSTAGSEN